MNYISTRDSKNSVTSATAIFRGISPEGGLYMPETVPVVDIQFITQLSQMGYIQRAARVLELFLTDYSREEILNCVTAAYSGSFQDDQPAPLSSLVGGVSLLELWHGPTCAFKDIALQLLPKLLTTAMKKVGGGKEAVILVATSGDTGKAALEGFRDVPGTRMLVFYPQDGVSAMQKRQMYTQQGDNLGVIAIDGNFDDAQTGVKGIFGDKALSAEMSSRGYCFSSANSINWGRLAPQIVYYFSAYCDMVAGGQVAMGSEVNFCVPTGNFGNILAAHYARRMGLPIGKLICASNCNDVLTEFINTGVYNRNRAFHATISPSMDILVSSNLERLLFELCGSDDSAVAGMMASLSSSGSFRLDAGGLAQLGSGFWGGCCDDSQTKATIKAVFEKYSYLCDTHTAVAMNVAEQYQAKTGDSRPMVVVSTASPYKFAASVLEALGVHQLPQDDFDKVRMLEDITVTPVPQPIAGLEKAQRRFNAECAPEDMAKAVRGFLGL